MFGKINFGKIVLAPIFFVFFLFFFSVQIKAATYECCGACSSSGYKTCYKYIDPACTEPLLNSRHTHCCSTGWIDTTSCYCSSGQGYKDQAIYSCGSVIDTRTVTCSKNCPACDSCNDSDCCGSLCMDNENCSTISSGVCACRLIPTLTPTPTGTSTPTPTSNPANCNCVNDTCVDTDTINGTNCTFTNTDPNPGSHPTSPCGDINCQPYYRLVYSICGLLSCGSGRCTYDPGCAGCGGTCTFVEDKQHFCGGGECTHCERNYGTYFCNGTTCDSLCVVDVVGCGEPGCPITTGTPPTGTPPPTSTCTITLIPAAGSVGIGSQVVVNAEVTTDSGSVDSVNFSSSNIAMATVSPAIDIAPSYATAVTGVGLGTVTITGNGIIGGVTKCTATTNINVTASGPWWQVIDADIATNGDIVSLIPSTCTLPACNPVFNLKGSGGYPGVTSYGGTTADFQVGAGTGTIAESPYGWLVNSSYLGKVYDYSYFARQIPTDITFTEITENNLNGGDFNSGGTPHRGYVWYHYNGATLGDLTISGNVNLTGDRKVVLLIEGADLYITGLINLSQPGRGFFMAVVGKDVNGGKGNIIVDPSVSHPNQPEVEGIFVAEGQFRTGAGTNQLKVRGSVTAYGGFILERNLANNTQTPAEVFEYAPDILSVFPSVFTTRRMRWKEVSP